MAKPLLRAASLAAAKPAVATVSGFHRYATRVARGAALFLAFLGVVLELPLLLFALASGSVPAAAAVKVETPGS
jgi:hypothetical protein